MNRLAGAAVIACAVAQPSCNQVDGDYPGCDISKMTHASSQPKAGKTWMYKYFNVQTPGDECSNDECDCSSTGAPTIEQGRVFTTRQISPSGGMAPGNGFGLHLVSVPGHKTTGGDTVESVFDSFMARAADGEVSVQMEQRVPDSILSDQDSAMSGEAVADTTSDYIVSLVVVLLLPRPCHSLRSSM